MMDLTDTAQHAQQSLTVDYTEAAESSDHKDTIIHNRTATMPLTSMKVSVLKSLWQSLRSCYVPLALDAFFARQHDPRRS